MNITTFSEFCDSFWLAALCSVDEVNIYTMNAETSSLLLIKQKTGGQAEEAGYGWG